ncbi:MAG: fatty acid desaturase family protein [Bacteroidota bacterium]
MKDKHIHIASDSELHRLICRSVEAQHFGSDRYFYLKLILKFVWWFALLLFFYARLYAPASPGVFVLCYILYGYSALLLAFNFAHDFAHGTVFRSEWLNNLCYTVIYTFLGAHAEAWKERHLHSHHHAPNVEHYDSDLKITGLIRLTPGSPKRWFHRYQHLYAPFAYTIYSLFWIFVKDTVILFSKDEYTSRKGFLYHLSFWTQKTVYFTFILVLPLLYAPQTNMTVLAGFLLMHLTQSVFLLMTFLMTHHVETTTYPTTDEQGNINASWLMNQVGSSNDMHPFSTVANFIFGGFNNHIAHHLFPNYHHIYYPKISRIVYGILEKQHIQPNHTTYAGGVLSHLRLLKRMGR